MVVGLDVGFGYVKYYVEDGRYGRFPSWVGIWKGQSVSDVEPIEYGGREYVVGEDAEFFERVEMPSFDELLRYSGVFVEYVKKKLSLREPILVGGLSARHYGIYLRDAMVKRFFDGIYNAVYPQGGGIFADVMEGLSLESGDTALVIDIGFNTVDYLLTRYDGEVYRRIALDTIEGLGVLLAVDLFMGQLPERVVGIAKSWSKSNMIGVFEKGSMRIEGKVVDLSSYRDKAISLYTDMLITRIKEAIGKGVFKASRVVVGGGGAYVIDVRKIREDAIIPENAEYSNARGFVKAYKYLHQ